MDASAEFGRSARSAVHGEMANRWSLAVCSAPSFPAPSPNSYSPRGGVSALVSKGLASMGAHMASGYSRVVGVHLAINHFRSAALGDVVLARAVPVHLGRSTQVWEVKLWKMDPSEKGKKGPQIAESRVTLLCNLPVPDNLHHAGDALKKYAAGAASTTTPTSKL
ncbi:1,4-dihydroxy-2-naphthoyl-CoA thioesterase 1-like [Hordeum vulgare subsp. vulgare]|nr:1,4-dihydroxy-2-naphthoyl-CoA thioesterase 1-like [Hordeum vulgare subsp. vulgare]